MTNNRFKLREEGADPGDEYMNHAPPIIPPCEFLREKRTGVIHAYSEQMARRGDLVEAYDGPLPEINIPVRSVASAADKAVRRKVVSQAVEAQTQVPVKKERKKKAVVELEELLPPPPPPARKVLVQEELFQPTAIPHDSIGAVSLAAFSVPT